MEQISNEGRPRRREYSKDFKAEVLAKCCLTSLTRFLGDAQIPIDNWVENQMRPIALGKTGYLQAACVRGSALLP